ATKRSPVRSHDALTGDIVYRIRRVLLQCCYQSVGALRSHKLLFGIGDRKELDHLEGTRRQMKIGNLYREKSRRCRRVAECLRAESYSIAMPKQTRSRKSAGTDQQ